VVTPTNVGEFQPEYSAAMSAAPTETPTAKPILIAEKTQSPVEESASFYHPHTHDSHYRPPKVEEKENLPRPIFLKSEDMEVATNETRAHNSAAVAIYGEGHVIKNAPNSAAMAIYGEDYGIWDIRYCDVVMLRTPLMLCLTRLQPTMKGGDKSVQIVAQMSVIAQVSQSLRFKYL